MKAGTALLALRMLRSNKTRSVIAGAAVILTALLFTTVISITACIMQLSEIVRQLAAGSDFHAAIYNVSYDKINEIQKHRLVKESYITHEIGPVTTDGDTGDSNPPVLISCRDGGILRHMFIEIDEGHYPENGGEILLDRGWLAAKGLPSGIGSEIILNVGNETRSFTLCGRFISYADSTAAQTAFTNSDGGDLYSVYLVFRNTINIQAKTDKVIADTGADKTGNVSSIINRAFILADSATFDLPGILLFALAVASVFLCGFLLIYNIYYISVRRDIHEYGLLKTLGTTGRQLKKIATVQVNLICLIAVPPGLAAGYFIGWGMLTPVFMKLSPIKFSFAYRYNISIFIFTLLFTYFTAFYSARRPINRIIKMSCVAALLEGESSVPKRWKKRSSGGGKTWRMVLSNLLREPKKTFISILSFSLSAVIFIFVFNMLNIMFKTNIIQAADFIVSPSQDIFSVGTGENEIAENGYRLTGEVAAEISAADGGGTVIPLYSAFADIAVNENPQKTADKLTAASSITEPFTDAPRSGYIKTRFICIPDEMIPYLNTDTVSGGSFDAQKFRDGAYIITNTVQIFSINGSGNTEYAYFKHGDKTRLPGTDTEYTVMCLTKGHHAFISGLFSASEYSPQEFIIFMSESSFMREFDEYTISALNVFANSYDAVKSIMSALEARGFKITDKKEEWHEFTGRINALRVTGYSICAIIFIIGVMNFINTTLSGVYSRRRELALLEIVGMTRGRIKYMLFCEDMCRAVLTVPMSLALGIPFVTFLFRTSGISTAVNILPALYMLIIYIAVAAIGSYSAGRIIDKGTPVERLRLSE
jgi:putative ABC transport system permease protein